MTYLQTRGKVNDYDYFSTDKNPEMRMWVQRFMDKFLNPRQSQSIFIEISNAKYSFYVNKLLYKNYEDGVKRSIGCVFSGEGNCGDDDCNFLFNIVFYLLSSKNQDFLDSEDFLEKANSLESKFIQTLDSEDGRRHTSETEKEINSRLKSFSDYLCTFQMENYSFKYEDSSDFDFECISVRKTNQDNLKNFINVLKKVIDEKNKHIFFIFTNLPVYKKSFIQFLKTNFDDNFSGLVLSKYETSEEFEISHKKEILPINKAQANIFVIFLKKIRLFFVKLKNKLL